MPAECRPDITLRKVWGNIEKYRIIKGIGYPQLARVMHMTLTNLYNRRNDPSKLKCAEVVYAAKYFGIEIEEMFK